MEMQIGDQALKLYFRRKKVNGKRKFGFKTKFAYYFKHLKRSSLPNAEKSR